MTTDLDVHRNGAPMAREQIELVKEMLCPDATDGELKLFAAVCDRTRLDPFARQIYPIKRYDARQNKEVLSVQVSIDGFRLVAERSGQYAGQIGPMWCGPDGQWVDVWLVAAPPLAAKVGIRRHDFAEPLWAVATYDEYCQTKKDGSPTVMWKRMPALMLAKCAESLGLRKAFPAELSGLYTAEEMGQADSADAPPAAHQPSAEARAAMTELMAIVTNLPDEDAAACKAHLRERFGPATQMVDVAQIHEAAEVARHWMDPIEEGVTVDGEIVGDEEPF